jgi:hypothetical protein
MGPIGGKSLLPSLSPSMLKNSLTPEDGNPMTKPYGISPYRYRNAEGQWTQLGWRVSIRRRGYIVDRRLNAEQFGGMDAAMRAAIAFRDEVNIECVPLSKREVCATVRTTNTSGIPGVIRTRDRGQDYWKARLLTGDGANRTRQFSIKKYGDQAAFDLAVQARSQMLEMVQGFYVLHPDIKSETRAFPIAEYPLMRRPCKVEPERASLCAGAGVRRARRRDYECEDSDR